MPKLDKLVVIDVEATCWKNKRPPKGQVSEIGWCLYAGPSEWEDRGQAQYPRETCLFGGERVLYGADHQSPCTDDD